MDQLDIAKTICKDIENKDYKALIVGGAVRDLLMDIKCKDVDISTNMPISELEKLYKIHDIGRSKDFGIVVINKNGFNFEIASFRSDGAYSDSRRPDNIEVVSSFEEDSKRRDFTINALGMTADEKIVDHIGGVSDINNKILRTVGDPKKRFTEDKLRIMRLVRFTAKLNFTIDMKTKKTAIAMAKDIHSLSVERIQDELIKAAELGGIKFAKYISLLDEHKILQEILPEIHALKYKPETKEHHPESNNTFGHILKALENAGNASPIELFGILFHDIGKGVTQDVGEHTAHHTYHSHDNIGAEIIKNVGQRLKFSTKEVNFFVFCCRNHMRFHRIPEMKKSKIAKLASDINFESLYRVCKADSMRRKEYDHIYEYALSISIKVKDQKVESLVSGNLIMKILNLSPGPEVGRIKTIVTEQIIELGITDETEIETLIKEVGK